MERLKKIYLGLPPGLRARVPPGMETWARERLLPRLQRRARAQALEARLWGGFSRDARVDLAALAADPATGSAAAAEAALALMRWHGAAGETEAALDWAKRARRAVPPSPATAGRCCPRHCCSAGSGAAPRRAG